MKRYALAILFFCAVARAQSPLGLHYPFGLPDMALTGSAAALGGGGAAVAEEYFGMSLNPANAAIGARSAFSAAVSFDFTTVNDGGKESGVSSYSPKLLSLILPMGVAGNLGFSMQRRYDANLNYYTSNTEIGIDGLANVTNVIELQNIGGLTAWQAGWGYRFKNGLAFGAAYERLFFNKSSRNVFETTLRYDQPKITYTPARTIETTTEAFASDGIRFGLQIPIHEKVTAAAAAEYIFKSENGESERVYEREEKGYSVKTTGTGLGQSDADYSVRMPPSMNIGLAYKPDNRWLVTADARTTLWDRYYHSEGEPDKIHSTYGVSFGGRFIPAVSRLSAKYWERILYSAGIRYDQLPIEASREYAFAVGTGLPIPGEGGVVDLVLEFGNRTGKYSKYSENTVRFQLGINGGRDWFQGGASNRY